MKVVNGMIFSQSNFTSYDGIHEELKKVLNRYLKITTDKEIARFILRQREANSTTYENSH